MARQVKRAFKYRFYPTDGQAAELSRTFGCVRLVYNKALEERTRAYGRGGCHGSHVVCLPSVSRGRSGRPG